VQSDYEIHPAANIFPMMTPEEYDGLKADILANGQREWAVLCDGKLLDGRNRMRACKELSVELECCELEPGTDPISYVLSKNLHRRHLTQSQRAMCAAEVAKLRRGDVGRGRPLDGSPDLSIDDAAKAFSVSAPSVKRAKHVADKGDKATGEAVKAGEITVSAAAKLVDAVPDKKEQRKVVKEGKKAVAAKIKESKPKAKRRSKKDADGGAEPVTSGPLVGMEPDPVGISEQGAAAKFRERLIGWTETQFNNIDDLSWPVAASVFLQLGDECETWN
jgi:polyhydroxyalkanoate synthesis regulator phasin